MRLRLAILGVLGSAAACADRPPASARSADAVVPASVRSADAVVPASVRSADAVVIDDLGDSLRLDRPFRRIVSLDPTTTEILFAIGAGERLVGRSHWDAWPAAALRLPDVGPGMRPNVEAVLAARPDLVLMYAGKDNRAAATRLRAAGVATGSFKIDQIEAFRRLTPILGRLSGNTAGARLTVDTVMRSLARVRRATAGRPRPKVLIPAWDSPLLVIGGGSFVSQVVSIAGGENVYGFTQERSPQVTLEDVVRRDPDVILISPDRRQRYLTHPRWRTLRAVREGRVLALDTAIVWRASSRLGESAASIARLLHPGVVP